MRKNAIKYNSLGRSGMSDKAQKKRVERSVGVFSTMMADTSVRRERPETTESIFRSGLGRSFKKHGKRGGASFTQLQTMYSTPSNEEHRAWERGEKVHYRAFNRNGLRQTLKDENFVNTIKAGMYGVVYKSNPCALKY